MLLGVSGLAIYRSRVPLVKSVNVSPIDLLAGARKLEGPSDAKVKVIEFIDYECAPCRKVDASLSRLRAEHHDIGWYVRQLPLTMHEDARSLASMSILSAAKGKLRQVHGWLYENQNVDMRKKAEYVASTLGIDALTLDAEMSRPTIQEEIDKDIKDANRFGAHGTPSIFVEAPNGVIFVGSDTTSLEKFIKQVG